MSTDPGNPERPPRSKWSCCLAIGLTLLAVGVLLIFSLHWGLKWREERASRERWEHQVAEVKAGKTTGIVWPEPRYLEEFVRDQPNVAAKITQVMFCIGRVSDERFGYLNQFPHLEEIDFDEVWEGADSFLKRIAGMESITSLSFYQTGVTEEGVRAVASFPNLKRLRIDYFWKQTSLEPLRGHRRLETLALEDLPITKEWIAIIASLPKLRELEVGGGELVSEVDLVNLRKALPNVKTERGK